MQKTVKLRESLAARLLLVLLAFILMIASSCIVMYNTLNQKLLRSAEAVMDDTQVIFSRIITEPMAILNLIANNVEGIYNRGEGTDEIKNYIRECSTDEFKDQISVLEYNGVSVYFEETGEFYDGLGWVPGEDYQPKTRPWYITAEQAAGETAMSRLYIGLDTGEPIVSYVRQVFSRSGELIGVVCIDVLIEYLRDMVVTKKITPNSYGFMIDEEGFVIMHPNTAIEGELFEESRLNFLSFKYTLDINADISLERTVNYEGTQVIAFGRPLDNGWYFILLVPESEYYSELYDMIIITGIIGAIFAGVLILMIMSIEKARKTADEEYHEKTLQLAAAEGATRAKSLFLAKMSHEIRTPMNAILGITEIQLQNDKLTPEVRVALDKIYNAGDLLLNIINDILDLSKIEANKLELICVDYETETLISETVQLNILRLGSKPIDFKLIVDENIPVKAHGDEMRIKQILNNILSNAFKYTREGTVTLSVTAENPQFTIRNSKSKDGADGAGDSQAGFKDKVYLIFEVSDTGQGMTKAQIDDVYSEYARFNQEANRTTEGTGLGLSITQNLVRLMGGEISVESEPGKGSVFTVRIAQGRIGSEVLGKESVKRLCMVQGTGGRERMKRAQITRDPMPYGSVLIVDDVETNIYVASGLMLPYGLKIDSAESGFDAIGKVESGKTYDIIFMDHMMPNMDGVEAVKRIRATGYTHPIIALTANAVAGQADMFLENGFNDFISKPIDVRQLNNALNKWIRDKQPPEVIEKARREEELRRKSGEQGAADGNAGAEGSGADGADIAGARIMEFFAHDVEKSIPVLEETVSKSGVYSEDDLRRFVIHVHGLKSALASIGRQELSDFARRLEMAGREGNTGLIEAQAQGFLNEMRSLLDEIHPKKQDGEAENTGAAETSRADTEYLRDKLLEIKDACEALDEKTADNALGGLMQKTWPRETSEVLEKLSGLLLHSDFDEAGEIAETYMREGLGFESQEPEVLKISDIPIPGLDTEKGLEKFDGNEEIYLKVLRSFTGSGRRILDVVKAYRDDDTSDYKIKIHGIKGMCFDIYADDLGSAAGRLEKAAGSGDVEYIKKNNPAFCKEAEVFIANIDAALARLDSRFAKPKSDAPDTQVLTALMNACGEYSMDKVDDAMREIDRFDYEADDGLVQWLREKVALLEFREVAERLKKML